MNTQEPQEALKGESTEAGPTIEQTKGGRPRNAPCIECWSGKSLRVRRIITGISATKLGRVLDVSQSTVLRWEKDLGAPTAPQVRALAQLLGCSPEDLGRDPKVV